MLTEANLYAYEFGMIAVGVAGLILCFMFYRAQLVPRLWPSGASSDTRSFCWGLSCKSSVSI